MLRTFYFRLPFLFLIIHLSGISQVQPLTSDFRKATIDTLLVKLEGHHVYSELAKKMTEFIRNRVKSHAYDTIESGQVFAKILTVDLQSVNPDGHLGIDYSSTRTPPESPRTAPTQQIIDDFRKRGENDDYGFQKIEILEGNIG